MMGKVTFNEYGFLNPANIFKDCNSYKTQRFKTLCGVTHDGGFAIPFKFYKTVSSSNKFLAIINNKVVAYSSNTTELEKIMKDNYGEKHKWQIINYASNIIDIQNISECQLYWKHSLLFAIYVSRRNYLS